MFLARSPRLVPSQALMGTPGEASDSDKKDLLGLTVSVCHDLAAQLTVVAVCWGREFVPELTRKQAALQQAGAWQNLHRPAPRKSPLPAKRHFPRSATSTSWGASLHNERLWGTFPMETVAPGRQLSPTLHSLFASLVKSSFV